MDNPQPSFFGNKTEGSETRFIHLSLKRYGKINPRAP